MVRINTGISYYAHLVLGVGGFQNEYNDFDTYLGTLKF